MTRPLLQLPVLILRTWEDHNGKKQQQPHLIHNHRTDFLTDLRCNDTVVEVWQLLGTALLVEVVPFPACHHHRHLFHAVCTCEIILIIIIVFYALCIISPSFIAHSPLTQRQHKNSAETKAEEKKKRSSKKERNLQTDTALCTCPRTYVWTWVWTDTALCTCPRTYTHMWVLLQCWS